MIVIDIKKIVVLNEWTQEVLLKSRLSHRYRIGRGERITKWIEKLECLTAMTDSNTVQLNSSHRIISLEEMVQESKNRIIKRTRVKKFWAKSL